MINSIEEKLTGPSPDDYNEWEAEVEKSQQEFLDDSSGAALDAELVKRARAEELQWLKGEKVYTRVPASEAQGPLLKIKWIDINKGDNDAPKVRSRLVAKEIRKAKAPDQQLLPNETFRKRLPVGTSREPTSWEKLQETFGWSCQRRTRFTAMTSSPWLASWRGACMGRWMLRKFFKRIGRTICQSMEERSVHFAHHSSSSRIVDYLDSFMATTSWWLEMKQV